jgi:hypothetical protein
MWDDSAARARVDLPDWVTWGLTFSLWTAIVLTIWSGVGYVVAATRMLRDAE